MDYSFQDRAAVPQMVAAGDYILRVVDIDITISHGKKTSGCDKIDLTLEVESTGTRVYDSLIFHPDLYWKIDTFLKAMNAAPEKGDAVDFTEDFLVGLRGWATLRIETYLGQQRNRVRVWLEDREKLSRKKAPTDEGEFSSEPF